MGTQKEVIDKIIDNGPQIAGLSPYDDLAGFLQICFFNLFPCSLLPRSLNIFCLVLFKRDLIYFDVPVEDDDILVGIAHCCLVSMSCLIIFSYSTVLIVPPLEGFVMNCVGGDYLETLLYKVLVALDAHTPVAELAKSILQVDLQLVKV